MFPSSKSSLNMGITRVTKNQIDRMLFDEYHVYSIIDISSMRRAIIYSHQYLIKTNNPQIKLKKGALKTESTKFRYKELVTSLLERARVRSIRKATKRNTRATKNLVTSLLEAVYCSQRDLLYQKSHQRNRRVTK